MGAENSLSQRFRRWIRTPGFYINQASKKVFGENLKFLMHQRGQYPPGSYQWLVLTEAAYGGIQLSAKDQERQTGRQTNGVQGGDRMTPLYHGYGTYYAEFLAPFVNGQQPSILVEVGILNGSGLAIWCDLFQSTRVVGLDIDLENFTKDYPRLVSAGAFSKCEPEAHWFDQLDLFKGTEVLEKLFTKNSIEVVIDDGCHTLESIKLTFKMIQPYLAKNFVYFIEDNYGTYEQMSTIYPQYRWISRGQLTICQPKAR